MDAVFIQDQWKATPRLTVNVGFRYDLRLWPIYGAGKDLYTGNANPITGQYTLTALPPNCSATVGAPCLPNGIYAGVPAPAIRFAIPRSDTGRAASAARDRGGLESRDSQNNFRDWSGQAGSGVPDQ